MFLKCTLCAINFDQLKHLPYVLPDCGHSICDQCIKEVPSIQCPLDDTKYEQLSFQINENILEFISIDRCAVTVIINEQFDKILEQLQQRRNQLLSSINQDSFVEFQPELEQMIAHYGIIKSSFQTFQPKSPASRSRIFEESPRLVIKSLPQVTSFQDTLYKLSLNVDLQVVNLKNLQLCDLDISHLGQIIEQTSASIKVLNLSNNLITDEGFISLIDSLRTNEHLTTLNMKNNQLSLVSLEYLEDEYQTKENSLSIINMRGNSLTKHIEFIPRLELLNIVIYI